MGTKGMYSDFPLRILPCYHCIHCVEENLKTGQRKCALTKRWARRDRAEYCNFFKSTQLESSTETINGHKVRKDQVEDYRTERQWSKAGFSVKEGECGIFMYASRDSAMHHGKLFEYFLSNQVQKEVIK